MATETPAKSTDTPSIGVLNRFATLVRKAHHLQCRRGIIEINESHRLYALSCCIRLGIRECINKTQQYKNEVPPNDKDFQQVCTISRFEKDLKQHFEFSSFAPKVFSSLRALVGITETEYLESLSPSDLALPCLEFITSSKSGMDFFLSNNKAFIMKTEKKADVLFLRKCLLRRLIGHFIDYPHSLLVKIIGCYHIKMAGSDGLYFTVMQSVFHPEERISERYDLKGCTASRYVKPLEDASDEVIVLKDNNFIGKKIKIGSQKAWFTKQVDIDTKFLQSLGVMDYSLLVGVQRLHNDEQQTADKLLNVVLRTRRSVLPSVSDNPNKHCPDCKRRLPTWSRRSNIKQSRSHYVATDEMTETDRLVEEILDVNVNNSASNMRTSLNSYLEEKDLHCITIPGTVAEADAQDAQMKSLHKTFCECRQQITADKCIERNQRLLVDTYNPLHVLDGDDGTRYFLGIIDVLTVYRTKKKAEHIFKALRYPTKSFSTVSPQQYRKRFREFCCAVCD